MVFQRTGREACHGRRAFAEDDLQPQTAFQGSGGHQEGRPGKARLRQRLRPQFTGQQRLLGTEFLVPGAVEALLEPHAQVEGQLEDGLLLHEQDPGRLEQARQVLQAPPDVCRIMQDIARKDEVIAMRLEAHEGSSSRSSRR